MILKDVLSGLEYILVQGDLDKKVNEIKYDSRQVRENDIFICISGVLEDGNKYAKSAIEKGASVIITEKEIHFEEDVTVLVVNDAREALAITGSNYYGNPKDKLKIIGITGTNGKTTTSHILRGILNTAGHKSGVIGTIGIYIGDRRYDSDRTTPESLELHKIFKEMVDEGIEYCVMEVSSHSLALKRVHGIKFEYGLFTNITHDHLDFHKTFENYLEAKKLLLKNSKYPVINCDTLEGEELVSEFPNALSCSLVLKGDINACNIYSDFDCSTFDVQTKEGLINDVTINMPGLYNISNTILATMVAINEGVSDEDIVDTLKTLPIIDGRFEVVGKEFALDYKIVVDFAHTPDALEKVLVTAKAHCEGKVICVFGCVGNGDVEKRPVMGKIATELADFAVITNDNPKNEDPDKILREILEGIETDNYKVEFDRKEAIKIALSMAEKGDIIIIAGRGPEEYMKVRDEYIYFTDKEVAIDYLNSNN